MVHVRYNGRTFDLNEHDLELTVTMKDTDIKIRVARHLQIEPRQLHSYIVDRTGRGNILVRPEPFYG